MRKLIAKWFKFDEEIKGLTNKYLIYNNLKDTELLKYQKDSIDLINKLDKCQKDLKDIIESETIKSKMVEETTINYVHVEEKLISKLIRSSYITTELNDDSEINALNDLLALLLPYIATTKLTTTENNNITITNEITILTNR